MGSIIATLCSHCAFDSNKNRCVQCGKDTKKRGAIARICSSCSFVYKNHCVKCHRIITTRGEVAQLCSACSFGHKYNNCIICGSKL